MQVSWMEPLHNAGTQTGAVDPLTNVLPAFVLASAVLRLTHLHIVALQNLCSKLIFAVSAHGSYAGGGTLRHLGSCR